MTAHVHERQVDAVRDGIDRDRVRLWRPVPAQRERPSRSSNTATTPDSAATYSRQSAGSNARTSGSLPIGST